MEEGLGFVVHFMLNCLELLEQGNAEFEVFGDEFAEIEQFGGFGKESGWELGQKVGIIVKDQRAGADLILGIDLIVRTVVCKIILSVFIGERPLELGFLVRTIKRLLRSIVHRFLGEISSRRVVIVVVVPYCIAGDWTGGALLLQMRWLLAVRLWFVTWMVWLQTGVWLHFAF